jgi:hypothetical protein
VVNETVGRRIMAIQASAFKPDPQSIRAVYQQRPYRIATE